MRFIELKDENGLVLFNVDCILNISRNEDDKTMIIYSLNGNEMQEFYVDNTVENIKNKLIKEIINV